MIASKEKRIAATVLLQTVRIATVMETREIEITTQ